MYMRTCDDGVGVKHASTWMMEFKQIMHIKDWEYKPIYIDTIIPTYILGWNDTCVDWAKKVANTGNWFKLAWRFVLVEDEIYNILIQFLDTTSTRKFDSQCKKGIFRSIKMSFLKLFTNQTTWVERMYNWMTNPMIWDDPKLLGDSGEVLTSERSGWWFDSHCKILSLLDKEI